MITPPSINSMSKNLKTFLCVGSSSGKYESRYTCFTARHHHPNHMGYDSANFEQPKMLGIAALRLPYATPIALCNHAYRLLL